MEYEEAKALKEELIEINDKYSKKLEGFEKNHLGMTPDHIRDTKEWKEAKQRFDDSFTKLQYFNPWFMKNFKKEYAAERRKRRVKA